MINFLKFCIFFPVVLYKSKLDAFNREYHLWKHRKSMLLNARIFLSASAHINIQSDKAKFISNGFGVHEYSQINLNHANSILTTGKDFNIYRYCNINIWEGSVKIGDNVLFNNYCSLNCMHGIEIGDNTWLGEGVRLYDHNHKFNDKKLPFTEQGFSQGKIKIGNNVWIGSNTIILQNVEIGDNCVIGANNLVYKSVPANTIVKAKAMEIIEEIK